MKKKKFDSFDIDEWNCRVFFRALRSPSVFLYLNGSWTVFDTPLGGVRADSNSFPSGEPSPFLYEKSIRNFVFDGAGAANPLKQVN